MGESEPDWRGQLAKAFGVNRPLPGIRQLCVFWGALSHFDLSSAY
jgi:hypothetical protein